MVTIFQAFMTMAAKIKNRVGPPAAAATAGVEITNTTAVDANSGKGCC